MGGDEHLVNATHAYSFAPELQVSMGGDEHLIVATHGNSQRQRMSIGGKNWLIEASGVMKREWATETHIHWTISREGKGKAAFVITKKIEGKIMQSGDVLCANVEPCTGKSVEFLLRSVSSCPRGRIAHSSRRETDVERCRTRRPIVPLGRSFCALACTSSLKWNASERGNAAWVMFFMRAAGSIEL
ncbi:hypothetical protein EVAR_62234_1 [Eumeta japonica]|uniref:Uncharacterized protein n=1 Tax=Eumeta variegata TaxID=151549 RepID=A0A4C1Z8L0_EUMVA|nr:hypothetical protein EVAR_62234_1 [Eumeta japonica]